MHVLSPVASDTFTTYAAVDTRSAMLDVITPDVAVWPITMSAAVVPFMYLSYTVYGIHARAVVVPRVRARGEGRSARARRLASCVRALSVSYVMISVNTCAETVGRANARGEVGSACARRLASLVSAFSVTFAIQGIRACTAACGLRYSYHMIR